MARNRELDYYVDTSAARRGIFFTRWMKGMLPWIVVFENNTPEFMTLISPKRIPQNSFSTWKKAPQKTPHPAPVHMEVPPPSGYCDHGAWRWKPQFHLPFCLRCNSSPNDFLLVKSEQCVDIWRPVAHKALIKFRLTHYSFLANSSM